MANVSLLDSPLFGQSLVEPEMRGIFDAEAYMARCADVEVALARAQARLGVIPEQAAHGIADAAKAFRPDMARLERETEIVGYPILPLVEQLAEAAQAGGRYLHWGATTQDIMDTATVLQIRDGLDLIERLLSASVGHLRVLAARYRNTPMAGRTHLQHALPITFGYKCAVWMSGLERHIERLSQLRPRVLVLQFSGASGTLASLQEKGLDVQRELAGILGLAMPSITWHSSRDAFAEAVHVLALVAGSLAKIAFDISIMMATELGEVSEPFVRHRGASSTMPQKRNPISCELIVAAAKILRQHSGLMLDAMVHDFERATGPWQLEWSAIPEGFCVTSGSLKQANFVLGGLEVYPQRMRNNLDLSKGLIVAEAVMMALAPMVGRQRAHDLVYAACRTASETSTALINVLSETPEIVDRLAPEKLRILTDPGNYLGASVAMVDRTLARTAPIRR